MLFADWICLEDVHDLLCSFVTRTRHAVDNGGVLSQVLLLMVDMMWICRGRRDVRPGS